MADLKRAALRAPVLTALLAAGVGVALTLGVIGSRGPGAVQLPVWWFTSMQSMKAWLATGVLVLVIGQVVTASWMYGRLPLVRRRPAWVQTVHRLSGRFAFLVSLPVGFYCMYSFGFETLTPRTTAHSIAGCAFYGAFFTKMVGLRVSRLPGWLVPALGGTVFATFVIAWYLSAWWWFQLIGYGR